MKTKTSILFFLLFVILNSQFLTVFSQPVTQEWVERISGPFSDAIGPYLQVDKNGNSYVAGTHVINDTINILCVKYNTSGVQQWYKLYKFPGYGYFVPFGLAIDTSGNAYVISGYALDAWTDQENGSIVRFNSFTGNIDWAKKYAGYYGWSEFEDIKIDRMNNIYVAGWSDSSHLVIRYNTNGDSVWVRKYHPPHWGFLYPREVARACTIDDSLNIIFTGIRIDYYPQYNFEYDSLLVVKYSSQGNLRWESVYAYNIDNNYGNNVGTKIAADQNGNLYIGGSTSVSSNGVYLTMKYDMNGVKQWSKIYNPTGSESNTIYGIAVDRNHNALFVTGINQVSGTLSNAATIKYNSSTGDSVWVRRGFGVPGSSGARDVEVDDSGYAYIAGADIGVSSADVTTIKYSQLGDTEWLITYNGPFNGGDGGWSLRLDNINNVYVMGESQSSSQSFDYIVLKYSQLIGIKPISQTIPDKFYLSQNYPNPFNPSTKIKFSISASPFPSKGGAMSVTLKIYDILGREIASLIPPLGGGQEVLQPGVYEVEFDGTNFASGIYFYRITVSNPETSSGFVFTETKKLVLLK